jgi:hypothetical protein
MQLFDGGLRTARRGWGCIASGTRGVNPNLPAVAIACAGHSARYSPGEGALRRCVVDEYGGNRGGEVLFIAVIEKELWPKRMRPGE